MNKLILNRSLLGAVLVFFVMPFLTLTCRGGNLMSLTGVQMVVGKTIEDRNPFTNEVKRQEIQPQPLAIGVVLVAGLGLLLTFSGSRGASGEAGKPTPSRVSAALAAIGLLFLKLWVDNQVEEKGRGIIGTQWEAGFWMAFLAAAGAFGVTFMEGEAAQDSAPDSVAASPEALYVPQAPSAMNPAFDASHVEPPRQSPPPALILPEPDPPRMPLVAEEEPAPPEPNFGAEERSARKLVIAVLVGLGVLGGGGGLLWISHNTKVRQQAQIDEMKRVQEEAKTRQAELEAKAKAEADKSAALQKQLDEVADREAITKVLAAWAKEHEATTAILEPFYADELQFQQALFFQKRKLLEEKARFFKSYSSVKLLPENPVIDLLGGVRASCAFDLNFSMVDTRSGEQRAGKTKSVLGFSKTTDGKWLINTEQDEPRYY